MKLHIRLGTIGAAAAGVLALAPAAASAATTVMPTSLTFAAQNLGTTSAPQTATVTVPCSGIVIIGACSTGGFDAFNPAASTTGDFAASESCPSSIEPHGATPATCDYSVTFTPTAGGVRSGVLRTGTGFFSSPGPTVALTGTGVAPSAVPATGGAAGQIKAKAKCRKGKKRKSASAAKKKCKKKK